MVLRPRPVAYLAAFIRLPAQIHQVSILVKLQTTALGFLPEARRKSRPILVVKLVERFVKEVRQVVMDLELKIMGNSCVVRTRMNTIRENVTLERRTLVYPLACRWARLFDACGTFNLNFRLGDLGLVPLHKHY